MEVLAKRQEDFKAAQEAENERIRLELEAVAKLSGI
jgi:hypothetical protein